MEARLKFPDFLVIGALKCGTTTLCQDLMQHPGIFMPASKEVGDLKDDRVLTRAGRASYADYFRFADPAQLCAEGATAYTRLPKFQGVPARVHAVCGPQTRMLYIVRDPYERIRSHHAQIVQRPGIPEDINEAVHQIPDFVDYSKYAMQLGPWLEQFPGTQIAVVCLEGYKRHRQATMDAIYRFVGREPIRLADPNAVHNSVGQRRRVDGVFYRMITSKFYKAYLQQLSPKALRRPLRKILSRPAPVPAVGAISPETRKWLEAQLRDDQREFAAMLGFSEMAWTDEAATSLWGESSLRILGQTATPRDGAGKSRGNSVPWAS